MIRNLKRVVALLAATGIFTCCDKPEEILPALPAEQMASSFSTYLILPNNHATSNNIGLVTENKLSFIAKFDSSAIYATSDKTNQADINKLYGFSDCSSPHHTNSARFGWRWFHDQLEIFAYTYKDGQRADQFIAAVALNQEYQYELEAVDNKYIFKLANKTVAMDRGCNGNTDKYKLFPYFGGDETAPHTIKIQIKEVK